MRDREQIDELLRARAVQADATQSEQTDLALVWRDLVKGARRVVDSFHTAERCYLVLGRQSASAGKTQQEQAGRVRILEAILLEGAQKTVAIDLKLPASTVAGALKQCLDRLGLPCTTSRISPLIIVAAYASQSESSHLWARYSELSSADSACSVVSVVRPDLKLARRLTPAQYAVVSLLVEGKSHHEIARARERSTRTIANQLGSAFRKLGVSGRCELIRSLITPAMDERSEHVVMSESWALASPITVRRYRARARRVLHAS